MRVLLNVLHGVLAVAYPVAVWWSLSHFSPRVVGLLLLAVLVPLLALRLRGADREQRWGVLRVPLAIMALLLLGVAFDDEGFMLAMPVLVNLVLLVSFGVSLRGERPMIERFARMVDPELDEPRRAHCRQATWAWTIFFALNGAAAAVLAAAAPLSWWAAYNGGIAYGLMGLMFAGEWIVRRVRFGGRPAASQRDTEGEGA